LAAWRESKMCAGGSYPEALHLGLVDSPQLEPNPQNRWLGVEYEGTELCSALKTANSLAMAAFTGSCVELNIWIAVSRAPLWYENLSSCGPYG
jgi:hypothetical protein